MERLTIDEIIEHCDRKTEMYEKACDVKYLETTTMNNPIKEYWEHKQVAEYLRKLKAYESLEEQDRLIRFYYCESLNEYYIGKRCGNFYYAEAEIQPNGDICLYYKWSRYLPWGETVVDELSLWKECTYPSEPKEISFEEWLKGWLCEAEAKLKELRGGE